MDIKVILEEQEEGGYTAYVPALSGCISEGDTLEEVTKNIREAIELYFFQEMTQEEAAEKLGIQQAAFSKRLDRALDKLRSILSDCF